MIIIFLGFMIGGLLIWLMDEKAKTEYVKKFLATLAVVIVMSGLVIGIINPIAIAFPISGYNEWEKVEEIEFNSEVSQEYKILDKGNLEVIEDSNCKTPLLHVYERTGKMSIWTFSAGHKQTKYVLYVPANTTSEEVKTK